MLIATILLVQFVAFVGALLFGRLAASAGQPTGSILGGLVIWMVVVTVGYFLPEKNLRAVPRAGASASGWSSAAPRRCPGRSSAS